MIKFDRLWKIMEQQGVTTYQLREKCAMDSKTIRASGQMRIWKPKR